MDLNIFEAWIGLSAIIGGAIFLFDPGALYDASVSRTVGRWFADLWNIGYLISGILIVYGLCRPSPRFELMGLMLLGSATAINGTAIAYVLGWRGAGAITTYGMLACAAWRRTWLLYKTAQAFAEVGRREE